MKGRRIIFAVFFASVLAACLAACSRTEGRIRLTVGTAEEGSGLYQDGLAISNAINETVTGAEAEVEEAKGSPMNILNLQEGTIDLGIVYGDAAYEAYHGILAYEGNRMDKLRAIGAVSPVMSLWLAREDSGIRTAGDLKGASLSIGTEASRTAAVSGLVLEALGIGTENAEIWNGSLSEGCAWLVEGSVDAAHGFDRVPMETQRQTAENADLLVVPYGEEELEEILKACPWYYRAVLPAGTYGGQEEPVSTFGVKILLCVSEDMDEALAHELAMTLDVRGDGIAETRPSLWAVSDKDFLCKELPIPLHAGAERYYREAGYLEAD